MLKLNKDKSSTFYTPQFLLDMQELTTAEIIEIINELIKNNQLYQSLVLKRLCNLIEQREDIVDYVLSLIRRQALFTSKKQVVVTVSKGEKEIVEPSNSNEVYDDRGEITSQQIRSHRHQSAGPY